MMIFNKLNKFKNSILNGKDYFAIFCTAFCLASFISAVTNNYYQILSLDYLNQSSVISTFILSFVAVCVLLFIVSYIYKTKLPIKLTLVSSALLFACLIAGIKNKLEQGNTAIFMLGIGLIFMFIVSYVFDDNFAFLNKDISTKTLFTASAIIAVIIVTYIIFTGVCRYNSYSYSCFDFGIFAQMFEKMRTTGLPLVTCERNTLMSHFGVHFSPFFYLLLPIYCIFPNPITLIVMQAIGVISGFVPLILICLQLGLSNKISFLVSTVYMLLPTIISPTLTDFHENKFLSVLILWTIYFMLKNKNLLFFIFVFLTLFVKEDAAIYIFAIALYIFFVNKDRGLGIITFMFALCYFVLATNMVGILGDGVMIGRLDNYIADSQGGFVSVIKTCFLNFGYFLSEIFIINKISYLIYVLLPLGFVPLFVNKKSAWLLLVPLLVMNIMPDWKYQYDINFQYGYGSGVLLIFLFLSTIRYFNRNKQKKVVLFSFMITFTMFFALFIPRASNFIEYAKNDNIIYTTSLYDKLISELPRDATYTANGYYIPHMYNFDTVYMYPNYYSESEQTEYLLVNSDDVNSNNSGLADFISDDYELVKSAENMQLYKIKD